MFEKIELEPSEQVLATIRKHWLVIVGELLGSVFLLFTPFILFSLGMFIPDITSKVAPYVTSFTYLSLLWILLNVLGMFMIWTHFYLDVWIVTDRRIIVIDQVHFFNRKVSSFRLERLQDIKVTINGLLATIFNFGTLKAQTAGATESNFTSSGLPDPRGIQSIIQKAMDNRLQTLYSARTVGTTEAFADN